MWEINNYDQIITFLLSCCIGVIFCVIYDIIRAMRRVGMNSLLVITIVDIFIWVFYAFVTFIFLIARTNGEVRSYVLFGELLGFILFRLSISKFIVSFLGFVFLKIAKINACIQKILWAFYVKLECVSLKLLEVVSKIFKSVKKLLKNVFELLYTNKNIVNSEKIQNETKTEA